VDQFDSAFAAQNRLYTNRAHALTVLGRLDDARALYLQYRGEKNVQGALLRLLTAGIGTKRTCRNDLLLVRFRATADMHARMASTASVVNDPQRHAAGQFSL
jgi:hypothetical protein